MKKLSIKALPKDLVDKVTLDITDLDINKTARIGDINIANVEVLGSKSIPIATIASPRALKTAATDDKGATAAAPAAEKKA